MVGNEIGTVYASTDEWPYVEVVGGELHISGVGPYVRSGLEARILERLLNARRGDIIYLSSQTGVGKSATSAIALYEFLKETRIPVIAVDLKVPLDAMKLTKFIRKASHSGGAPLLYVDTSPLERYYYGEVVLPSFADISTNLRKLIAAMKHTITMFVADGYVENNVDAVEEILARADVVDPTVDERELYAAIIQRYSGCPEDVAERAANIVLWNFADYYAVASIEAARILKKSKCDVGEDEVLSHVKSATLTRAYNRILQGYGGRIDAEDVIISAYSILYNERATALDEPREMEKEAIVKVVEDAVYRASGKRAICGLINTLACSLSYEVERELKSAVGNISGDVYDVVQEYVARRHPMLLLE